jgi:hypothetical protein
MTRRDPDMLFLGAATAGEAPLVLASPQFQLEAKTSIYLIGGAKLHIDEWKSHPRMAWR